MEDESRFSTVIRQLRITAPISFYCKKMALAARIVVLCLFGFRVENAMPLYASLGLACSFRISAVHSVASYLTQKYANPWVSMVRSPWVSVGWTSWVSMDVDPLGFNGKNPRVSVETLKFDPMKRPAAKKKILLVLSGARPWRPAQEHFGIVKF